MTKDAFDYTAVTIGYNVARTLDRTLQSLEGLEPRAVAIIAVDDASTDNTAAIAGRHELVKVVRLEQNRGASAARNEGARHVLTPWILFADSDCYVDPAGFRMAIRLLWQEPELDGVMAVFQPDAPSGPFAGRFKNFYRHCEIAGMDNPPHVFTSACFLMRKAAYDAVGGFNESFGKVPTEDNEFYFRFIEAGMRMKYLTDFSFTHDKPMGLGGLFRDDAARVEAIALNLRGRLGAPRQGFRRGERLLALVELAAGLAVLAGPMAIGLALLLGGRLVTTTTLLWCVAIGVLSWINARVLRRAVQLHGIRFALGVICCRGVEMAAAAWGMARAIFAPRNLT